MDAQAMMLLGMVEMKHPTSGHTEMVEVRGFDVLGFFFPWLRLMIDGQFGKGILVLASYFTVIGIPLSAWYVGFNFKKMKFESRLKSGWTVVKQNEKQAA